MFLSDFSRPEYPAKPCIQGNRIYLVIFSATLFSLDAVARFGAYTIY